MPALQSYTLRRHVPERSQYMVFMGLTHINATVSTFFLTQFLTSLLWVCHKLRSFLCAPRSFVVQATVAAKHSPRLVLTVSLLGSAVTCCLFGTSTSIQQAIAIRLMQGVFAGAIGVARGCVASITDQSNEGRAYAILG